MTQLIILFVLIILIFVFLGNATNGTDKQHHVKQATNEYLSNFNMYLCLKNKLLLYPPKEVRINNGYCTLNLSAKSDLLPHKNINAGVISKDSLICNECLHHCSLKINEFVDLKISFNDYRQMSNEAFKKYLQINLTEEQFNDLFGE